jgi:Protein of unknown function (DUF3768)
VAAAGTPSRGKPLTVRLGRLLSPHSSFGVAPEEVEIISLHQCTLMSSTDDIRRLNDRLRRSSVGGKIFVTRRLAAVFDKDIPAIVELVSSFDDFSEDNDPYGEHDFGSFAFKGQTINWKIDYYALDMQHGSEDPANAAITKRVLTILLAEDY